MKTIVFVMPRLPFPAVSGRKNSLYHYCKILHQLGYRVVVLAFLEPGDIPSLKPEFIDRLEILQNSSLKRKLINIVQKSLIKKTWPLQVGLFWSLEADAFVKEIVKEEAPVAIIADMVRTTEYLRNVSCIKIADLDDLISLRYQRQLEYDLNSINPYGSYLRKMPEIIQKILLSNRVKQSVVKREIELLRKYECSISREFDKTIFVAQKEADLINEEVGSDKVVAIPIGVDYEYFSHKESSVSKVENMISFLGQMSVAHNESAAIYFIEKILPMVKTRVPKSKFVIIGGGVSERLFKYASEDIIITGRVDDVRTYIQKSKVFVCPLKFGSGIKTKNLEAMAMGVPVVTTEIGAENIDAKSDEQWYIVRNDIDFVEKVVLLLEDEKKNRHIGKNGQQYVKENWTWDKTSRLFKEILP